MGAEGKAGRAERRGYGGGRAGAAFGTSPGRDWTARGGAYAADTDYRGRARAGDLRSFDVQHIQAALGKLTAKAAGDGRCQCDEEQQGGDDSRSRAHHSFSFEAGAGGSPSSSNDG